MVIDCDSHIIEPTNLWSSRLPTSMQAHAPLMELDEDGFERLIYMGVRHRRGAHPKGIGPRRKHSHPAACDANSRLKVMDEEKITSSFIFPTRALIAYPSIKNADIALHFCKVYNDWLAEFCYVDPNRLFGVAVVPAHHDIYMAIEETRRTVTEHGFRGVVLRPNLINGKYLNDKTFDLLWATLSDLRIPLFLHEGSSALTSAGAADREDNYGIRHILSHRLEQEAALVVLVMTGVFQRHPNLKVVLLESGCGWLPSLAHRMDEHFGTMPQQFQSLKTRPSVYIQTNIFVAAESGEPGLVDTLRSPLSNQIVFGSDFPHFDSDYPDTVAKFVAESGLDETSQQLVFEENPKRLLANVAIAANYD